MLAEFGTASPSVNSDEWPKAPQLTRDPAGSGDLEPGPIKPRISRFCSRGVPNNGPTKIVFEFKSSTIVGQVVNNVNDDQETLVGRYGFFWKASVTLCGAKMNLVWRRNARPDEVGLKLEIVNEDVYATVLESAALAPPLRHLRMPLRDAVVTAIRLARRFETNIAVTDPEDLWPGGLGTVTDPEDLWPGGLGTPKVMTALIRRADLGVLSRRCPVMALLTRFPDAAGG